MSEEAPRQQGPAAVPFEVYTHQQEKAARMVEEAEARAAHAELRASMDVPTGVMKGEALAKIMDERIKEASETVTSPEESTLAAVVADVTGLKELNSTIGHQNATKFLAEVAQLLQAIFRAEDVIGIVARIGGDEFLALLDLKPRELEEMSNSERMKTVMIRASKIVEEFFASHHDEKIKQMHEAGLLNVAMGYSVWQPGWDAEKLVDEADKEMYQHKDTQHEYRNELERQRRSEIEQEAIVAAQRLLKNVGRDDLANRLD